MRNQGCQHKAPREFGLHGKAGAALHTEMHSTQGFAVYVLKNLHVELAVVPALGAKIISLKNVRSGREWLWHPGAVTTLFTNQPSDVFSQSPLVGVDECLPTIAPCSWQGRDLPDHGEVWNMSWHLDEQAWARGKITTIARLKVAPFEFKRTIQLQRNVVNLQYELKNLASTDQPYLWALHPLLRFQPGDQLELPPSTRHRLTAGNWNGPLAAVVPETGCLKAFASPLTEGQAAIKNTTTGDRLEINWPPKENHTLGLWLSCGGWHGHHHLALEPTNAADDSLTTAITRHEGGLVNANGTTTWSVSLHVGN